MSEKKLDQDYGSVTAKVNLPVSFDLATALPLDKRSLLSKVSAEAAAAEAKPAGNTSTKFYYGMPLTVLTRTKRDGDTDDNPTGEASVELYAITADNKLQKLSDGNYSSLLSRLNDVEEKSISVVTNDVYDENDVLKKHSGLKITTDLSTKEKKIEIDDTVTFIFDSGRAGEN